MSREGYVDRRGNNNLRKQRRAWLLATFDPDLGPDAARCAMRLSADCLGVVDTVTLSVDRIVQGGSYRRDNIQPGCKPCQDKQGGVTTARGSSVVESYRAARDAVLALRESNSLAPSTAPGTAGADVAMHQLEDAEFAEHVPLPMFRDWLIEQGAARRDAEHRAS